jgi:hypothetical protein
MEPVASASAWSKIGATLKDWPLWLLAGAATSATVFVLVPEFRGSVKPATLPLIYFGSIALWVLTAFRSIGPALDAIQGHRRWREARIRFVLSPIPDQCAWGVTKQDDGTLVTQLTLRFMARNRTEEPLYLVKADVVRPKIKGEILTTLLALQAPNSPMHGTAHVSGHYVPAGATLPGSLTLLVRGAPKQMSGALDATLDFTDGDSHRERVRSSFRFIGVPLAH